MTKTSQTYSFKRLSVSKYHKPGFLEKEAQILYSINNMEPSSDKIILITNSNTKLEDIDHELLKKTVLLIHPNSGHDNITPEFINKNYFPILLGNTIRANAVSEYIMSCIFKFYCKLPSSNKWEAGRVFNRKLLSQSKFLIIGYGHIGKIVYSTLQSLGCQVHAVDPFIASEKLNNIFDDINNLKLETYDAIILASSLNPSSYQMIDKKFLSKLNDKALIINPARGNLIYEDHLVEFLKANQNSFAFLDVFKDEPFTQDDTFWPKNCFKTSHIAGVYKNLDHEMIKFEEKLINSFINNKKQFEKHIKNYSITNNLRVK